MTSEHGTSGPDNSESDLIRSLGELSEETLQQLGQFPPAFLETLAGLPAEAQTSLLRIPLETLCQLSDMDAATLEWLGKLAVTNGSGLLVRLGQLAKDAPGAMLRLQELPAQTLQILAVLPSEALMSLIALPPEQLADLPAVLRAIGEPSDEDAASTGEKQNEVPASLTETLDLFSPEAVKLLAAFDAKAMASLSQVRPELVQTLTSVPEELLRGLAEVSSGMLTTVTELSADGVQSLSEIDSVVLTDIAEGVKNTESSVPQALMMKLGTLGNTDGSMLGRLVEEARSMRELQGYSADAGKSADAGEAPIAGAPEMDDRDADDDAAGDTFDDEEGNSQTLMINDGGREVDDPGATIQSDEFAAVDEEGDSDPSYGATVQSDDFSDFSHIGTPPSEDSQDSYGATIQSDEFEAVGDISDTGYEPPIQSGEDWSADGISVFDQNEDGSYDKTVQSGEFGIGDATQSDADDGSSETMQSDEGWSEDGLNALDRDDDDSFGATIQSDSFDGAAAQDDDAFGATIQSDSFDGLAAPDDSFGQTIQSDSMDVDDPGYGATIASGVFSGHAGSPGGGDLTHEESNMKDAWKESGPSRTQAETGRETSRSRGSSIPDTTLVITTRKVSTQNIKGYNRGKRPPEPREPEYELVKVLGEGGMGIVFTARQRSIDRDVAFKMLKPKTARDRDQRAKFLSEAVVTGELDHPNIVPIYDVGATADQALFYSMKKVQGIPWLDVIRDKSTSENLDILMRSADAVAFAHSRGVIHRDLKPENTMLGEFGEVLVMDWGLAYSTDEFSKSESVTASTSMGGTPAYMAPEMATGPVSKIGPHSDVYLLGAILFEIVTKRPPHAGKNAMKCLMAAARNQIRDPDPDNCTKNDPTGELMEIALKALETKPEDRFQTVQAFQA
ncbi:MAG: protein kinase, partial [Planctomycetaceae bacterium]